MSEDLDELLQNVAFHYGLYQNDTSGIIICHNLEILTYDSLICTMNQSMHIVSNRVLTGLTST